MIEASPTGNTMIISVKYRTFPIMCIVMILLSSMGIFDSIYYLYVMKDIERGFALLFVTLLTSSIAIFFGWPKYLTIGEGSTRTNRIRFIRTSDDWFIAGLPFIMSIFLFCLCFTDPVKLPYAIKIYLICLAIFSFLIGIIISFWFYFDTNIVDYDSMINIQQQIIPFKWLSLWMYNLKDLFIRNHIAVGMIVEIN